jgi:hypothetical protein
MYLWLCKPIQIKFGKIKININLNQSSIISAGTENICSSETKLYCVLREDDSLLGFWAL